MNTTTRCIAFYLPQYHSVPENDLAWGKGFTEWTNVRNAKPLYRGHKQPVIPGELGYYNLLDPEIREKQADLAKEYGIEGFCYWHYWFGNGKRVLEKPFDQVLASGKPDFPFCLAWANESWSGIWHGLPEKTLIEQTYPGEQDSKTHFYHVLTAFRDERYIKINGKPVFVIHRPKQIPDLNLFVKLWQKLAIKEGLNGIYFIAEFQDELIPDGIEINFDAITVANHNAIASVSVKNITHKIKRVVMQLLHFPVHIYTYKNAMKYFIANVPQHITYFPCVIPNWDNTPRCGVRGIVLQGSTPELFKKHLKKAVKRVANNAPDEKIIFIKSWNEWAEGNYLEPDERFGRGYLEVLKEVIYTESTTPPQADGV